MQIHHSTKFPVVIIDREAAIYIKLPKFFLSYLNFAVFESFYCKTGSWISIYKAENLKLR